jgi:hypothetical protein
MPFWHSVSFTKQRGNFTLPTFNIHYKLNCPTYTVTKIRMLVGGWERKERTRTTNTKKKIGFYFTSTTTGNCQQIVQLC